MFDNDHDDDVALDAALSSWLSEALDLMRDTEQASWSRFSEETLPEKDAWVRFSAIMTRAQQGVHQMIDHSAWPARRGTVVRLT